MRSTAASGLLAEIDTLAYPDRMRLLAGRARALSGTGEIGPLLDDLYRGDRFQREIAGFLATVAGPRPTIMAALADEDFGIHRAAVSVWLRSGWASAADLVPFVMGASWHTRRRVYRLLRRLPPPAPQPQLRPGPRHALADELIGAVWDRFGDAEAARLLPACSADT